jgi:hypothetical protein
MFISQNINKKEVQYTAINSCHVRWFSDRIFINDRTFETWWFGSKLQSWRTHFTVDRSQHCSIRFPFQVTRNNWRHNKSHPNKTSAKQNTRFPGNVLQTHIKNQCNEGNFGFCLANNCPTLAITYLASRIIFPSHGLEFYIQWVREEFTPNDAEKGKIPFHQSLLLFIRNSLRPSVHFGPVRLI